MPHLKNTPGSLLAGSLPGLAIGGDLDQWGMLSPDFDNNQVMNGSGLLGSGVTYDQSSSGPQLSTQGTHFKQTGNRPYIHTGDLFRADNNPIMVLKARYHTSSYFAAGITTGVARTGIDYTTFMPGSSCFIRHGGLTYTTFRLTVNSQSSALTEVETGVTPIDGKVYYFVLDFAFVNGTVKISIYDEQWTLLGEASASSNLPPDFQNMRLDVATNTEIHTFFLYVALRIKVTQ